MQMVFRIEKWCFIFVYLYNTCIYGAGTREAVKFGIWRREKLGKEDRETRKNAILWDIISVSPQT